MIVLKIKKVTKLPKKKRKWKGPIVRLRKQIK